MSLTTKTVSFSLSDKIAIVTGGAQGIGKAIAEKLSAHGARVVIADLSGQRAASVAKKIDGVGVKCDVTKEKQIKTLVSEVKKTFGTIDIFVSNAGVHFGEKKQQLPKVCDFV